jgi:hypothetical protein
MKLHGLVNLFDVFGFQFPYEFYQPPAIHGSDLVGFDLGVFGQIASSLGKENLKSVNLFQIFGSDRKDSYCAGKLVIHVIGNHYDRPGFSDLFSYYRIQPGQKDIASLNIHPSPLSLHLRNHL